MISIDFITVSPWTKRGDSQNRHFFTTEIDNSSPSQKEAIELFFSFIPRRIYRRPLLRCERPIGEERCPFLI